MTRLRNAPPAPVEGPAVDLDRFDAFTAAFRSVFPRADQFRRFQAYLLGLLTPGERKNVEAIASRAAGLLPAEPDLVQALQHFVSRSPWDAGKLLAAYRAAIAGPLADPAAAWVVHDAAFPKKGRHSVGVQRQFARPLGRKLNCQVAVVVGRIGPRGYFPLAARLYLPGHWLQEWPEQVEKTVPEEARRPATKGEIALALLDELRAEGGSPAGGAVLAEGGYAADHKWAGALRERGLAPADPGATLADAQRRFDALQSAFGLGHFEGRTWLGWHHHVGLVFTASAFAALELGAGG